MSSKAIDITGKKFTRLTAIKKVGVHQTRNCHVWEFVCDCGNTVTACKIDVSIGKTKSCGCLAKELFTKRNTKHGNSRRTKISSEYRAWIGMLRRCSNNPTNKDKKNYLERGITVCIEWVESFETFLNNVGEKPCDGKRWSLGRVDNNKGYYPDNCRWETSIQQARNRRKPLNNTTGTMNVQEVCCRGVKHYRVVVGRKSKSFSCEKYGEDEAKALAISWREKLIKQLSEQGEYHAESHGK